MIKGSCQLKDNHVLITDDENNSFDITEEGKECDFCIHEMLFCKGNRQGCCCDQFKCIYKEDQQ